MASFALLSPPPTLTRPSLRLRSHLLPKSTPSIFSSPRPISTLRSLPSLSLTPKPPLKLSNYPIRSSASPQNDTGLEKSVPTSPPQGAKIVPLLISVAIGLLVRFVVPKPAEVTLQAWQLLSIFLSTIAGLVLSPLPVGAWAFLGLTTSIITKTLSFSAAFSAFTNEVIWLIVISFFFARGFVKTGLGDRIATYFVKWLGKSTLGLSYGLTFSEALIAPAMPSTTARAGGVFLPIIKSLSLSAGSKPGDKSSRKLGAYLVQSQFQSAGNSSALFLTAAAQNLLCLKLAEELGVVISSPWVSWFKAACLPAFVSLLVTPFVLYKLYPPETKDTPEAPAMAAKKLELMGPVTKNEWTMVATMLLAVTLWVFGDALGIASVVAAMLGLSILLLLGVLDWDDCLSEKSAWDTLAWFAVLVGMASQLTNLGIVTWMSDCVAKVLSSFSLSWPAAFGVLQAAYFLIHYMFASQTGHVGALYSAFLAMNLAAGVPGVLAALALAFNTNLFGALTHYSSGQAAVYFGAGYVDLAGLDHFARSVSEKERKRDMASSNGVEEISSNKMFDGYNKRYKHYSQTLGCQMTFSIFFPQSTSPSQKFPVLYWLSGLTCTDENFIAKSGAQRVASSEGIALVAPDTSPRGLNVEGEADSWDFGLGAGFYLNAKQDKWKNWQMYDYVVKELPKYLSDNFPQLDTSNASISGHSMGGHGALTIYLKNLDKYKSVSAFSPIVNPINCPWGQKAFSNYLGDNKAEWEEYDATCLIEKFNDVRATILIDQGEDDKFLKDQLLPHKFDEACRKVGVPLLLRRQPGYDHSYFFIATFIDDHIRHHAQALNL